MVLFTVNNVSKNTCLGTKIRLADTFLLRLRGLLGTGKLDGGEGLLLRPCQMVHGFGMRFAIEAVYLDRDGRVIKIHKLKPGRGGPFVRRAVQVLELPLGTVSDSATEIGDLVQSTRT
ncbi:MAG: DUF192 domain-containing protein [Firmicutes bacterium]|jgi:uncharacterized membrane protein (UPF0127 family)|nr:DUF192 domain-containing protein [Bacillota bacterium]NLL87997.1 DUF192 domain-containing protein [Bacillota bacterium]